MRFNTYCLLLLCIILNGFCQAQNHPPFSRMDVFELEWASDPQISPDGQYIVYSRNGMDIMKDQRMARLWMMKADGSEHMKLTQQDVGESSPRWSPDGSRIAYVSGTAHGAEIFVYWVKTGKTARLTQLNRSPRGLVWSPDGQQIAFVMKVPQSNPVLVSPPSKPKGAVWADPPRVTQRLKYEADGSGYTEPGFSHIFVIPAEGGTARQLTEGDFNYGSGLAWAADGKSLIFSGNLKEDWEYDFRNSEIYRMSLSDATATALTERKGPDHSPTISPDGSKIAYIGYDDKVQTYQISRLYLMNADGSRKTEIDTKLDRSISSPVWDAEGNGLFVQYDEHGDTKIAYISTSGKVENICGNLGGTAIGRPYGGGSFSVSGTGHIAFTHSSPYHPAELAVIQKGDDAAQLISGLNHDLLNYRNLGQVEEVWYPSTVDGLQIQGWIVKPPNFDESRKYPLLVENHGGPISNYGPRFSPEVQLYATAGYVVFYPNPRGSTGYGESFGNELYHNYPGDDYQDVMDGVDVMIEKGYVSEDSLFVTGGSAGGIMTAWIIGKNTRFRAAAVVKPVMNWVSKTLTADNYFYYAHSRYPGQPWENIEAYMKFSPVSLVGNIETPTLVMVGTADLRTPLSEAKQLYSALKIRKIETALVEIPGSYHFISRRPSQLITKIDHVVAWFDQYRVPEEKE